MFPEIVSIEKGEITPSLKRLVLEQNWNNKLFCSKFIIITSTSDKFKLSERFDVRIKDRFFCYATVLDIQTFRLSEIVSLGYNLFDCGLEQKEFMEHMADRYRGRKWWKDGDTSMQVIFFNKVEQLKIPL